MVSWHEMLTRWIDAGALYGIAVDRADDYEKEHRGVDEKWAKLLNEYRRDPRFGQTYHDPRTTADGEVKP